MSSLKTANHMETTSAIQLDYLPKLPRNLTMGIGCIGSGFIMSDCQLVAYRKAGFNPVAIASKTRANSETVAIKHGIKKVYDSYLDLLADEEVTIVDIAVPPDVQLSIIREAVKHNDHIKGILAQKPLGVNLTEAK